MLGLLGFDPDEMQRRLGDGFYEQRLVRKIFNDGVRFDAGNGEVGYSYRGLEAIVDPVTKRVVTFRPEKNRGG